MKDTYQKVSILVKLKLIFAESQKKQIELEVEQDEKPLSVQSKLLPEEKHVRFEEAEEELSEPSANTSSNDEDEFDELCEMLSKSSYSKINMFFLSICDKNLLNEFLKKRIKIQNKDVDKLDVIKERIRKELSKICPNEEMTSYLYSELDILLTYLNYHYEAIPSFNSGEFRTVIYCMIKFVYDNSPLFSKIKTKPFKDLLVELNDQDYTELLMDHFKLDN